MSVAVFQNSELEALWGALDPKDTDVARTLFVLGCANRAAYMTSYSESVDAPRIEAPRVDTPVPGWAGTVTNWLKNLLYNCVTNGGTDFAAGVKDLRRLQNLAASVDAARRAS